jgi:hypothetical protein
MSNHLARRAALVAVVALVAAIGSYFLFERAAPPTIAADRIAHDGSPPVPSAPNPVELAPPTNATEVGATEAAEQETPELARAALGDAVDGRTWRDLIVAVDRTSGAPIADAHLALIDADGELRRPRLDESVLATDLASGVLLALDSPSHVPRFFFAEHLVNHTGAPRSVALHPSAALKLLAHGDDPLPKFDVQLYQMQDARADELDAHLIESGFETSEAREPFLALGKSLRHLLEDSNDARGRKRQMRWLARTESLHSALTPDGPPTTAGWSNFSVTDIASLPIQVDDLVGGVDILFEVKPAGAAANDQPSSEFEFKVRDEGTWRTANTYSGLVAVAERTVVEIELRNAGVARVRGSLPSTSSDARAFVVHTAGGGPMSPREETLPTDRAFVIGEITPGRNIITLQWRTPDGAFATREFDLTLAAGEERDLGAIDVAADGCELVVATSLHLDGAVDLTGLGGRLDAFEVDVYTYPTGAFDRGDVRMVHRIPTRVRGPGEAVIRGLPAGVQFVSATALELPPELTAEYRQADYPLGSEVTLGADRARVELQFHFTSALEHTFRLNVPATVVGAQLQLEAWAFEVGGDRECEIELEHQRLFDKEPRHRTVEGRASVPSGEWIVVAVARPSWRSDGSSTLEPRDGVVLQSYVGSTALTANTAGALVVVDLALAAVADGGASAASELRKVAPDGSVTTSFVGARPRALPNAASRMWYVPVTSSGQFALMWCLFPNSEYVDHRGDLFFRAGAAGSVIELERH